jgi:hypothetical protein
MVSEPKIKGRDDEKLSTESLVTVSAMIPIKRMSQSYIDKHVYWLMDMEISVDKLIRIQFKKKTKVFVAFLTYYLLRIKIIITVISFFLYILIL